MPNPPEICNFVDDDCNGLVDDVDLTSAKHCGKCGNDCTQFKNVVSATCTPPPVLDGKTPGKCDYSCATDSYDIVKDDSKYATEGCEYYCPWNTNGANTQDLGGPFGCDRDDDCDGKIDEDVDLCGANNCGKCGKDCSKLPHAQGTCVKSADAGSVCTVLNAGCGVLQCDPGWKDANLSVTDGCEMAIVDGG